MIKSFYLNRRITNINSLNIILKTIIILVPLFVNKNIYNFRINQEAVLKLLVIIALFLWLLRIINNEDFFWQKSSLNLPIFIFILVISVSWLVSKIVVVSLRDYTIFLAYFLIYLLIINNVNNQVEFFSLIKLFFIISFIVAIYALMQYYGLDPYLKEFNALTSTIGQKNWISNYLAMTFPLIFSYFLLENIKKNKLYYYLLLSIIYATLMICQSRGIWISIVCSFLIGIFLIYKYKIFDVFKKNKKWITLIILTFLFITIIYSTDNPLNKSAITVSQRAISTFDEQDLSLNMHLLEWNATINMIKDKPWFGSGIGTFKMNYLDYQAEILQKNPYYTKYSGKAGEAHNEYLQMGAELGLVGLGVFISIVLIFYRLALDFLKKEGKIENKIIFFGLFMGITCFLIHALFSFPLHVPALGTTFFILFSLAVVYIEKSNLQEINNKNKILKKINLKNPRIKIVFNVLLFIIMILVIVLLVIKPYLAEIYYFTGMRHDVDKNYDKALPNFEFAVLLDPYNGRILHALGTTYYKLKVFDKAEEVLQRTKKYIIDANTFYNLGLIYWQVSLYKKAEEEFKQAIYLNPKFTEGYHYLGLLYFQQEDYDKTVEQWNKILEIEPNFPNKYIVLNNLGIVYQKKEMTDKALEYFVQALQLVPEGDSIEKEIEEEINKIYKSNLEN
jgi:O-antigen ligase/Tfp pilus assembly protein PilF